MTLTRLRTRLAPIALVVGTAFACSDSTSPAIAAVMGSYTATELRTTENGSTTNHLAAGASIVLVLNANGTTTGHFVVPGELDANLAGTWSLDDDTVDLDHSADTFLRDILLMVRGNQLVGDEVFSGTRVQITLTKQ